MSQAPIIGSYKTVVLSRGDGRTEIVYYQTPIVRFGDSEILLNTGNWWTRSTKSRMNQVSDHYNLGYRVFAKNSTWYVAYQGKDHEFAAIIIRLCRITGEVMPHI